MTIFLPRLVGVGSVKLIRSFHRSCKVDAVMGHGSYEGEGKTTVTILNRELEYGLMIDGISTTGFKLNNGVWVIGPTIVFPRSIVSWNIATSDDINEDALTLLRVVEPTLDLLILGLDQKYKHETPFIETMKKFAKRQNTNIEILPVEHACTTFNFMNAESRYVAAALLPPKDQLPKGIKAIPDIAMRRGLSQAEKYHVAPE